MSTTNSKRYKGYNADWGREATRKYTQAHQHTVVIRWKNEYFADNLQPFFDAAKEKDGTAMAAFIKEAIEEKIDRDFKGQKKKILAEYKKNRKDKITGGKNE